jgi:hypothetical protein
VTCTDEKRSMVDRMRSMHHVSQGNPQKAEARQKIEDVFDATLHAISEVRLMAPQEVWSAVVQAATAMHEYADAGAKGEHGGPDAEAVNELLRRAITAMRKDLGEHPVGGQ